MKAKVKIKVRSAAILQGGVQYVEVCGLKHEQKCNNRISALSLDEIATQLSTNKCTLQELLEIERKLTPEKKNWSMKERLLLNHGSKNI